MPSARCCVGIVACTLLIAGIDVFADIPGHLRGFEPKPAGRRLEMRGDRCSPNPCENGGKCMIQEDGGFKCDCTGTGFTGRKCCRTLSRVVNAEKGEKVIKDCCSPNPCKNGGKCTPEENGRDFTCDCSGTGFSGSDCQETLAPMINNKVIPQEDPCLPTPCMHGGTCKNEDNGYKCECDGTGYTGENCERIHEDRMEVDADSTKELPSSTQVENNACSPNPCKNGGTCSCSDKDDGDGFMCACNAGFMGNTCEEFDACYNNPCKNGSTCQEKYGSSDKFTCLCREGFIGPTCENESPKLIESPEEAGDLNNVDPCTFDPCKNGGSCETKADGEYMCICKSGFRGANCQENVPVATPEEAVLPDVDQTEPPAEGVHVELSCDILDELGCHNPCDVPEDVSMPRDWEAFEPFCPNSPHYDSTRYVRCGAHRGQCWIKECCAKNGETHWDDSLNACVGPNRSPALAGSSGCGPETCRNGGWCEDVPGGGYECKCPPGYEGRTCNVEVDACELNPCGPGEICRGESGGRYRCQCPAGYTGQNCETRLPDDAVAPTGASSPASGSDGGHVGQTYSCDVLADYGCHNPCDVPEGEDMPRDWEAFEPFCDDVPQFYNRTRYVRCGAHRGQCLVMECCAPYRTMWDDKVNACVLDPNWGMP